ncbi:MAG TPA: M1 family metallopeptidase [Dinghuibacter sp.]|uniref:M1 family metallopeptidase n=1 Tax=Dinghuibacter sp. TaxID=2024697 RepID=UPI002CF015FB|nr:M1 family metallopeptidase [Dinghuibacter sp.]HTJ10609.1 M1 family metallopeptidase [Dinghuibacter sp.]
MYRSILCLVLAAVTLQAGAQTLYVPRDIKPAYKKGTRSPDGRPGPHYWQNTGKYDITVTAMPPGRTVRGSEDIAYTNNSPDTLKSLVIRLVLNVHKPGAARYGDAGKDYLTDGVHIDKYAENGEARTWKEPDGHATWAAMPLATPLLPHATVRLSIDWHYEISLESGREGMLDSTTYYLAYFYPRVSVYDDYNGWDRLSFTDGQEFYNDFNDYTLHVRTPANYVVWATGTLQNPGEVLQPAIAQRLQQSMTSDQVSHIATLDDMQGNRVTAQAAQNTWTWTADHITDMTVCLSNHYVWDGTSVVVDDKTGRRVSVQSAFNDKAEDFHHAAEIGSHAIGWLSHNWPGVPYPFPKMTLVQGFADMEYPMMINDNTEEDVNFARLVADHEIAHTYFPFYMGINESRYAYMDEGWATTFELLIGRTEVGDEKAENFYKAFRVRGWINDPSSNEDLPVITPSNNLNGVAYGNNSYGKPSLGYLAVKDMLGDDVFKKCLHTYMDRWHGKHPIPWDFFYSFNDASGQNLNWFWSNWYFSNGYIDYALRDVKDGTVTVENVGGFDAPFDVIVRYADGTTTTEHEKSSIWQNGDRTLQLKVPMKPHVASVTLDGGIWMDATPADNTWKAVP